MSWFSRKKRTAEPTAAPVQPVQEPALAPPPAAVATPPPAPVGAHLAEKWDQTIQGIQSQFRANLHDAVAGSEPLLAGIEWDLGPLTRPWQVVQTQCHKATDSISDAWNDISDEMSDCDGFTHEMMEREGNKRDLAKLELELEHERARGNVMVRAAQGMLARALQTDVAERSCMNCGARLDKVRPVSTSLNVECGYCDAVNTVNPGDGMRMFAASGALILAQERARPANETMRRTELHIRQYRDKKDVPLELLSAYERASRDYWTTLFNVEAEYVPEKRRHVPQLIESRLKESQKLLRGFWQWRDFESRRNQGVA